MQGCSPVAFRELLAFKVVSSRAFVATPPAQRRLLHNTEAFNEGMAESTGETLGEARTVIAACDPGTPQAQLYTIVDHVERGMIDGSLPTLKAAMMLGSIKSAAEDGCDTNDIETLTTLYPDLSDVIGQ